MLWWISGIIMESNVDFWLLCMEEEDVNMYVGLLINVFFNYWLFVEFKKCFIGVVILLKCVGLFNVRVLYCLSFWREILGIVLDVVLLVVLLIFLIVCIIIGIFNDDIFWVMVLVNCFVLLLWL